MQREAPFAVGSERVGALWGCCQDFRLLCLECYFREFADVDLRELAAVKRGFGLDFSFVDDSLGLKLLFLSHGHESAVCHIGRAGKCFGVAFVLFAKVGNLSFLLRHYGLQVGDVDVLSVQFLPQRGYEFVFLPQLLPHIFNQTGCL